MSIFGSRKKTTVGTSISRVIEDDLLPDSIKQGMIQAYNDKSDQVVEYVMDEMLNGMALRVDRMYRYGKNHYVNGLPQGTTYSSVTGRAVVEQALEADVGPVDTISYYKLGAANLLHLGWLLLVRDHAYDSVANTFMVGTQKVYLTNMQPVVVESNFAELENGSMDQWGVLPNMGTSPVRKTMLAGALALITPPAFLVDPNAIEDYIKVQYAWEVEEDKVVNGSTIKVNVVKTGELNLSNSSIDLSASYFQVRFTINGKAGYWMYKLNSGDKPAVDAIFEGAPNTIGTFYPWSYFRFNKQSANDNKTSAEYLSTKKMLNMISINYEDVTKSINNPDDAEAKEDIKDVEQAMMVFAVPAKTEIEIERRYLFDFFSKMYTSAQVNGGAAKSPKGGELANKLGTPVTETTIVIKDAKFKMALSFSQIVKRRIAGNIGKVGTHTSGTNIKDDDKPVATTNGIELNWSSSIPTHYYRRQITDNLYEELLVTKLKMVYFIYGDYTETAEENEPALLIPLDYEIVSQYQMLDREVLYGRSMHYVFNSRIVTKLKWYQTGIFRAILSIAAVIVSFYNIYIGAKMLAAAATLQAAVKLFLMYVVKYLAVKILIKLFVKIVGAKVAFIVALVAAVVGVYKMIEAGSITGAPWAKELLSLSSNLSQGASKGFQNEFNDMLDDYRSVEREMEEKQKKLDEVNDLLDANVYLTPMLIWGESPTDFYQRTVHSGNIGIVGIEAVSSYVDIQLRLPKISDTLGEYV